MLEQRGQTWMLKEGETYRKDVPESERGDRLWRALEDRQILRGLGEKAARMCRWVLRKFSVKKEARGQAERKGGKDEVATGWEEGCPPPGQ